MVSLVSLWNIKCLKFLPWSLQLNGRLDYYYEKSKGHAPVRGKIESQTHVTLNIGSSLVNNLVITPKTETGFDRDGISIRLSTPWV